jgi:hypothetical protein
MKLIRRLLGHGKLVADGKEFTRVQYDIEIWQAESGVQSARGIVSVSPVIGPGKLTLEDGKPLNIFVTTSGSQGATIIVKEPVPSLGTAGS